jgi:hypothetical protein
VAKKGGEPAWQTVYETAAYLSDANRLFTAEEQADVVTLIARDPEVGEVMQGTGGVRKVRVAREGMGKSGGARVVYFLHNESMPVYVMAVFGKNEKANLSKAERNALKKVGAALVAQHKKGRK